MKKTKIKKYLSNKIKEIDSGRKIRGITLISLIVTVIILLILAGVSINFIFGNEGIFSKTQLAVERYQNAQEQENYILAQTQEMINGRETVTLTKEEYALFKSQFSKNTDTPIVSINMPNTWTVGIEYSFGDGVCGQRFTGTITESANTYNSTNLCTAERVISYGGWWQIGTYDILRPASYADEEKRCSCVELYPSMKIINFLTKDSNARSNMPYDIWVLYTK